MSDSSPDTEVVAVADVAPEPVTTTEPVLDGNSPASSSGEEDKGSMLDAVKAAIEPKAAPPAADTEATADADAPPKTDAETKAEEFSPEEFAQLSQKTQSRLKKLNSETKRLNAEVERLAPMAKEFEAIDGFVKGSGLSNDDVSKTLQLAAQGLSDPRGALVTLRTIVSNLERQVGEQLSPELQQRVDQGFLTAEDAKALSRAQADAGRATSRVEAQERQQRLDNAIQAQQQATTETLSSVDVWEKAQIKSDPDFHLKRSDVADLVKLAILEESNRLRKPFFPTPEQAVKYAKTALETVNKRYARFTPKPTSIKPENGGVSSRSVAEPKTFMDAVRAGAAA